MNKNELLLKILAEEHIVFEKYITKSQFNAIKNSKYGKYLKEDIYKTKFDSLLENVALNKSNKKETYEDIEYPSYELFNLNTDRRLISYILHNVEDHFDIGILNDSLSKYKNVNLKDIKKFIEDFLTANNDLHENTINRIKEALTYNKSVKSLMLDLRSMTI
jgi:hypothetical protein